MVRVIKLLGLWLMLLMPLPLAAQAGADPDLELFRRDRSTHPSETNMYRELGIGEFGAAFSAFYTARSYNISNIRGLDHSLATSWLYSFDPWGLGFRTHIEYRASTEWRLSLIPRADVAFGILNNSHHETFGFETLPFTQNYPARNDAQKLSLNLELEFSARWRWLWLTAKGSGWMAFRRTHVKSYPATYEDPQLGTLDHVKDRNRVDWDQGYVYGLSTGVGFEFFFVDAAARFIVFLMARPFNTVMFRGDSATTNGAEFVLRSADFELTDHAGIYFEFGLQLFLQTAEFNDIYYTQFSLGVRWR
jgi:hypothetical protein